MAFPALSLPKLVLGWISVSSLLVVWDAAFVLLRPRTLVGGDLHYLFSPYALYIEVDRLYGDLEDKFVVAQSLMNLLEVGLALIGLFWYVRSSKAASCARWCGSLLMLIAQSMTLGKTVLYIGLDWMQGWKHTAHNDTVTFLSLYLLPNGMWIWMPAVVICSIFGRVVAGAYRNEKAKTA